MRSVLNIHITFDSKNLIVHFLGARHFIIRTECCISNSKKTKTKFKLLLAHIQRSKSQFTFYIQIPIRLLFIEINGLFTFFFADSIYAVELKSLEESSPRRFDIDLENESSMDTATYFQVFGSQRWSGIDRIESSNKWLWLKFAGNCSIGACRIRRIWHCTHVSTKSVQKRMGQSECRIQSGKESNTHVGRWKVAGADLHQ